MDNPALFEGRVLHIVTRSEWGGAQQIVYDIATRSETNTGVACAPGGQLIERLEAAGVPVYTLPTLTNEMAPVADLRVILEIARILRMGEYDLIHCHSAKAGVLGRLAASVVGVPAVFTVHGWGFNNTGHPWRARLLRIVERLVSRITDRYVFVSEQTKRTGEELGIVTPDTAHVVYNGVNPTFDDPAAEGLLPEFVTEQVVIGTITRLTDVKNPLAVLRTALELDKRGIDVTTLVVGDGPLRPECERFIAQHDIPNVHLLGFLDNAQATSVLKAMDVFLLPSKAEGLPLSLLESLQAGVPAVAYAVGGVPEVVADGETGYLVTPGAEDAFVDCVERLVVQETLREEFSAAASKAANDRFTTTRMVDQYDEIYADLIA